MPRRFALVGITIAFFCCQLHSVVAQWAELRDVVNVYHSVTAISHACSTVVGLDAVTGISAGDRVVVIQMQGAVVDVSATDQHGSITSIGQAGRFEFATVAAVDPSQRRVVLRERLQVPYDISGSVQFIRVSHSRNAAIVAPVTAPAWNGRTGGVVVIEVQDSLLFQSDINVFGRGFAGGALWNSGTTCSVQDVTGATNSQRVAQKGSGIAVTQAAHAGGRGRWASGGGGGAAHNSGGGGGGNAGAGGRGGNQWLNCGGTADNGGFGGSGILFNPTMPRVMLGGGGGSGQQNDRVGTAGERGGGIVILSCKTLNGTGSVLAGGGSVTAVAQNDGAGGAGAGGAVWLQATNLVATMQIDLTGGAGGNTRTGTPHGPGGGGGGGLLVCSGQWSINQLGATLNGGQHGENLSATGANRTYFAKDGEVGSHFTGVALPQAEPVVPPTIVAPPDTTLCANQTLDVRCTATAARMPASITWAEVGGPVLSNDSALRYVVLNQVSLVCSVVDNWGCSTTDTFNVDVQPAPKAELTSLALGALGACRGVSDTSLRLVNTGSTPLVVRSVRIVDPTGIEQRVFSDTVLAPAVTIQIPIVARQYPRSPLRIQAVVGPCDTTVEATVTWTESGMQSAIQPTEIAIGPVPSCALTFERRSVTISVIGASAAIVESFSTGNATWNAPIPDSIFSGVPLTLPIRIVGDASNPTGRVGVVVQADDCIDTLWCDVTVLFEQVAFALDTIVLGPFPRCEAPVDVTVFLQNRLNRSVDVVYVASSNPSLEVSVVPTTLEPLARMPVSVRWKGGAGFSNISIYLPECDSSIVIPVRWTIQGALFSLVPDTIDVGEAVACSARSIDTTVSILATSGNGTLMSILHQGATSSSAVLPIALPEDVLVPVPIEWLVPVGVAATRAGFVIASGTCIDTLWCNLEAVTLSPSLRITERHRVQDGTVGTIATRVITITNDGNTDIDIASLVLPDAPFGVDTSGWVLPRRMIAGEVIDVDVEFNRTCGVYADSFVVESVWPCNLVATTILEMEVTTSTAIEIANVTTSAGSIVEMPVVLMGKPDAVDSLLATFELTLTMMKQVANPIPSDTRGYVRSQIGETYATVTVQLPYTGADTIARIPVLVLLGGASIAQIEVKPGDFQWLGLNCSVNSRPGTIELGPPCAGNGRRLVKFGGGIVEVRVGPNPTSNEVELLVVVTQDEAITYQITNLQGQPIAKGEGTGNVPLQIDIRNVASGVVMLTVATRFETAAVPIHIIR